MEPLSYDRPLNLNLVYPTRDGPRESVDSSPRLNLLRPENFTPLENKYSQAWVSRMGILHDKRVVLKNPREKKVCIKRQIESTRYHPAGQARIKRKIHDRLGASPSENGILLTLTVADLDGGHTFYQGTSRLDAWRGFGYRTREFMDRVNKLRKTHGKRKIRRYIKVLEDQKGRRYPCPHIWFPGLKGLAYVKDVQKLWPYGNVDLKYIQNMTPANYIIKYISKMEGHDFMQAMIWHYRLRLFSTSRDFKYTYQDKPESPWRYSSTGDYFRAKENVELLVQEGYSVIDPTLIQPRGS